MAETYAALIAMFREAGDAAHANARRASFAAPELHAVADALAAVIAERDKAVADLTSANALLALCRENPRDEDAERIADLDESLGIACGDLVEANDRIASLEGERDRLVAVLQATKATLGGYYAHCWNTEGERAQFVRGVEALEARVREVLAPVADLLPEVTPDA